MDHALTAMGALLGALGIITASLGTHAAATGNSLNIAANFLLFHGLLLMLIPALVRNGLMRLQTAYLGSAIILVGISLFSGELVLRALAGRTLFFMAAPAGGSMLIIGWIIIALSALLPKRFMRPSA